jgi:hypothetical protein
MGMDNAVETITQVLSVIDRTPTSYESVCPAPENALNHTSTLIGICSQAALPREFLSGQSTAQNFRIILRSSCIVKKRPPLPVGLDVHISLLRAKFRSSPTDDASILAVGHRCKKVCVRHASFMNIARVLSHGNDTVVFDAMSSSVS